MLDVPAPLVSLALFRFANADQARALFRVDSDSSLFLQSDFVQDVLTKRAWCFFALSLGFPLQPSFFPSFFLFFQIKRSLQQKRLLSLAPPHPEETKGKRNSAENQILMGKRGRVSRHRGAVGKRKTHKKRLSTARKKLKKNNKTLHHISLSLFRARSETAPAPSARPRPPCRASPPRSPSPAAASPRGASRLRQPRPSWRQTRPAAASAPRAASRPG